MIALAVLHGFGECAMKVHARTPLQQRNKWQIRRPPYVVVVEIARMAAKSRHLPDRRKA